MKYVDSKKIDELLEVSSCADSGRVEAILDKARQLQRLSLEETAVLLSVKDPANTEKIFETAAYVKNTIYG